MFPITCISTSLPESLIHSYTSVSRVLVKHHGWQWLLGHAYLPDNQRPVLIKFDDIIDEKHVSRKQVILYFWNRNL